MTNIAMSKYKMLEETLLGNLGEQIPISIWKHHPELDRTPEGLAKEEIAFLRSFDHDLMKISFHGRYPVVDWGCVAVYDGAISGSTTCDSYAIEQSSDWEVLEPLDVNAGEFGNQIRATELIHRYAEGNVPIMATIFDPPMVADKLCDESITEYFEKEPELMHRVLQMITSVMIDFAQATLDAGADGLFIASQHSTLTSATDEQYEEFVYPYDEILIKRLRGKAKFIVMHLHAKEENEEIRVNKIARVPGVDAINWEDQSAALSLKEGKKLFRKAVFGGIDHNNILRTRTPDEVKEQVRKAMREAGLRSLVVAPGCVITIDTPHENIQAVVDEVRSIDPWSKEWEGYI